MTETDLETLFALGKSKSQDPATREEGQALILEAAHRGHAEAAHRMALSIAMSTEIDDRWSFALAYLGRAAKNGHDLARRTLAFLARDQEAARAIAGGGTLPVDTWQRLHDAIDLAAWRLAPSPTVMSEDPHIATVTGLLPPDLCDWIVARGRPCLKRALVYNAHEEGGVTGGRTNSEAYLPFEALDLAMLLATDRIMQATCARFDELERFAVLHYRPGQEFRPHYDFFDPDAPADAAEIKDRGQRLLTLLVYLNDDYSGGETDFPKLGYRCKGRKGDTLLFRNLDASGAPDRRMLHAGLPPASGEKWLLSQWVRKMV